MKSLYLSILAFCVFLHTHAQRQIDSVLFKDKPKREKLLFPFMVKSPETSWGFGGISAVFFEPKKKDSLTRTSDINLLALYTLNKQMVVVLNATVFWPREEHILRFQSSASRYPDNFWGLGNNTGDAAKENFSQQQFLFNPQFLQQVHNKLYVGASYQFQSSSVINFIPGGVFDKQNITGRHGGKTSGLGGLITWDSRNAAYSPDNGGFAEIQFVVFNKAVGSDFNFTQLSIDLRKYIKLGTSSVLGLQGIGGVASDATPYRYLEKLGGPDMMRGYYAGRFTDKCLMAYQAEIRQALFWRVGCVFFASAGEVGAHVKDFSLNGLHYGYGTGLRFALSTKEKLNLRIDYGVGKGSNALNVQLREAF